MVKHAAAGLVSALTICMAVPAYAGNGKTPPPTPPKPAALDVTMTVVPLNADIEKTVAQTITIPVPGAAAQKPTANAHTTQPAAEHKTGIKGIENTRAAALRETAEARREAAEAAKEARKDSNNSSSPDNDTPPLR